MKEAYIGIDPGKTGYITIYADGEFDFYEMPTHPVPNGKLLKSGKEQTKPEFHEEGFISLFSRIQEKYIDYKLFGCIEKVVGRQHWSAQNNFTFGYVAGLQKMLLIMLGAEITMVRPQKWQATMYGNMERIKIPSQSGKTMVNDTKAMSAKVAQILAPKIIFSKQGVKKKDGTTHKIHDGKTDSFLICLYLYTMRKNK